MENIEQNHSNVQMLIPVQEAAFGEEQTQTVNARDLHDFLGVKTRYNDWINRRISEFSFVEDIDFVILKNEYDHKIKDLFVTIDMAKELSMVERNEKGRQARRFFIECEKQLRQKPTLQIKN